jgi:hypothetical protein
LPPGSFPQPPHPFRRIIGCIGEQRLQARQQSGQSDLGSCQGTRLARRPIKTGRMAQRLAACMDLGGQSAL